MALEFEWDAEKADANRKKHGMDFHEAATVFADPLSFTFEDSMHSRTETRFITIGMTRTRQLVVVAHTDRNDSIRVISARKATRKERRFYEEARG